DTNSQAPSPPLLDTSTPLPAEGSLREQKYQKGSRWIDCIYAEEKLSQEGAFGVSVTDGSRPRWGPAVQSHLLKLQREPTNGTLRPSSQDSTRREHKRESLEDFMNGNTELLSFLTSFQQRPSGILLQKKIVQKCQSDTLRPNWSRHQHLCVEQGVLAQPMTLWRRGGSEHQSMVTRPE
ncbi:hypothetical protein DNTS_033295, partial [Danionella cerebrum]